jgi:hypothetical protein
VDSGQDSLEWSTAAVAVWTRELPLALIARIAAIRRIADPFVNVNVAAALAAAHASTEPVQQAAVAEDATGLAAFVAVARTRRACIRTAIIAGAVPNDRMRTLWQAQAARCLAAWAARHATATAAK